MAHISHRGRKVPFSGPGSRCGAEGNLGTSEVIVEGGKGAEILGLMLESRRFMRPTACAFQPQASAGETKRCGLCVANY